MRRTGVIKKKMPINVFPALLSTSRCICDVIRNDFINNKNLFNRPKMILFFSSTKCSILSNSQVPRKNWRKKIKGFDCRGTVWFRGGMGTEISSNYYNSRNICHSEERLSVLESLSHALSDDIFGGFKLDNLHTTFL